MVITFVLHPLFHYNSITEPHAQFLLSLIKNLSIDFPSCFILSLIYVYKDMATHDKLIFHFAFTRIIRHSSISYPKSSHFTVMGAISAASIRRSKAQLQPKRPRTKMATPPAFSVPSTSASSSSTGGVTLEVVMAQLVHMDTRLDTFITKLYQVNTHVSYIAR